MAKRRPPSPAQAERIIQAAAAQLAETATLAPAPTTAELPRPELDVFVRKHSPFVKAFETTNDAALRASWRWLFADTVNLAAGLPDTDLRGRQTAAIVLGIATEKILLLEGKPTSSVLNIHEVRGSLPDLLAKLSGVRAAIEFPVTGPRAAVDTKTRE